ncbi:MAG: TonB-dependent receptor [Bacteroidetes bacterium]|nr:TonB-dependent receptor [Bacteroidota bacterium]
MFKVKLTTKFTVFILFLLLGICNTGNSQVTISGKIYGKESGKLLAGANVTLMRTFIAGSSDNQGIYVLRNLKPGLWTIRVSFMGFKTNEKELFIRKDTIVNFTLETNALLGEEVNIIATRAQSKTPTTYTNINQLEIDEQNLGQDLPFIIENTPSVTVNSDAGTGIGYTNINIRGTDLTRINVTMNGIPVNDPESQGVWFVDLPDLASSTDNIQIQRGVGTSTNGAAAFGASINIQTTTLNQDPYGELNSTIGSFNTFKNTFRFGSGLLGNNFSFDGRISRITSDGYIDRASSRLTSFFLSGGYFGKRTTLKFNILSGYEKTYQAWGGVPKDSLTTNRTYNPQGEYYDQNGVIHYYDNQTDNYTQTHYQLIFSQKVMNDFTVNAALHYTKGAGYYENYKQDQPFANYNLKDVILGNDTIKNTDLINQKWLDNDFYGLTFSGNYSINKIKFVIGGAWNQYSGKHYGKIIWARYASNGDNEKKWYDGTGGKRDFNIYFKVNYQVLKKLNLFADLQYRDIYHKIAGTLENLMAIDEIHKFSFFNPKAGVYYDINDKQHGYFSFAIGNREPNRNNYEVAETMNQPVRETMYDYELGYNFHLRNFAIDANLYYMNYSNQLVLTGKIDSVGEAIMTNVPHSFREGIEITATAHIFKWLNWNLSSTLSRNKIKDFTQYIDKYDSAYNFDGQESRQLGKTDLSFSPSVILTNNFSVRPVRNLHLTLISRYVGKQYIDNTSNNYRVLDPCFVNNVGIGYDIHTKLVRNIGINLMINNLFSAKYNSNGWVYPYIYNNKEYEENGYFPQALINFLLGISLSF